jgi:hypothetical protein
MGQLSYVGFELWLYLYAESMLSVLHIGNLVPSLSKLHMM